MCFLLLLHSLGGFLFSHRLRCPLGLRLLRRYMLLNILWLSIVRLRGLLLRRGLLLWHIRRPR